MSPPRSALYKLSIPFSTPYSTFLVASDQPKPTSLRRPSAKTSPSTKSKGSLPVNSGWETFSNLLILLLNESSSTLPRDPTEM